MIYKLSIYLDIKGDNFDPTLMPEALEVAFRPFIEKKIIGNTDFPYSTTDTFSEVGTRVAHLCKAKSLTIDFMTKSQVLSKMGK